MIVWCGRCDTNTVELPNGPLDIDAVAWFGHTAERPWCEWCIIWAIYQWPRIGILVAQPVVKRQMRDADA